MFNRVSLHHDLHLPARGDEDGGDEGAAGEAELPVSRDGHADAEYDGEGALENHAQAGSGHLQGFSGQEF